MAKTHLSLVFSYPANQRTNKLTTATKDIILAEVIIARIMNEPLRALGSLEDPHMIRYNIYTIRYQL